MFLQSIDTALAALYCTAHHSMYVRHMGHKGKLTAAQQRNLFVELCYSGLESATSRLNVPKIFHELGYIDPKKAQLRIPYQFVPPSIQPQAVAAAKPKPEPKPIARQLSMNAFLAQDGKHINDFPWCCALLFVGLSNRKHAYVILFQQSKILSCVRDIISVRDINRGVGLPLPDQVEEIGVATVSKRA